MSSQATLFGLMRHAPTLWNEKKLLQGQQDSPLSVSGQQMAEDWGRGLTSFPWQRVICSDLGRTRATAELINESLHVPIHPEKRLREQDWGEWVGMTLAEVKTKHKKKLQELVRSGWLFRPPGGESRNEVLERSLAALQEAHMSRPGEPALVVCHEGVIKCLLYHLTGRKFLPEEPPLIQPHHLHIVEYDGKTLNIKKLNCKPL